MSLADIWSKWILPALKILGAIAVAIFAVCTAHEVVRLIRQSREGQVSGAGQPFRASPEDPGIILVETPIGTEPVQLPAGITAPDVRAVVIVPAQPAVVEVLNEIKDRRAAVAPGHPGAG
jgi:hypothetical protein